MMDLLQIAFVTKALTRKPEYGIDGIRINVDCSDPGNQDNPLCVLVLSNMV